MAPSTQFDLGSYFYDDSESDSKPPTPKDLSWRLNPEESLSDWTIIVTTINDESASPENNSQNHQSTKQEQCLNQTTIYHVHKSQLGVGKRQSEYFSRLFRSLSTTTIATSESVDSTSRIDLNPSAASAFPSMLDFLYCADDRVNAKTETAVALRHLSNYFGISALWHDVNTFIQDDLRPDSAPVYLQEGHLYSDLKMIDASNTIIANHFCEIKGEKLSALHPDLFLKIVRCSEFNCESAVLSVQISDYCECRPDAVSEEFLRILTDFEKMPVVHTDCALHLLRISTENGILDNGKESLRSRCVEAASRGWQNVLVEKEILCNSNKDSSEKNTLSNYGGIPPNVKIELLENALVAAYNEIEYYL